MSTRSLVSWAALVVLTTTGCGESPGKEGQGPTDGGAGLGPTCQRRVRQLRLETYVPMGGEWIPDRAETSPYS